MARMGESSAYWALRTIIPNDLPEDTSTYVDITLALIESTEGLRSTDPIMDIIFESIDELFAGVITAQDAARIIQNRAAIFVAERS